MGFGVVKRVTLLVVVVLSSLSVVASASADDGDSGNYTSFDISWPQCPNNMPQERFEFAIADSFVAGDEIKITMEKA